MIVTLAATAVIIGLVVLVLCVLTAIRNGAAWAVQRWRGRRSA